jgi:hypothetical protein
MDEAIMFDGEAELADESRFAFAAGNRAIWDTPEEDIAWQWLQEAWKTLDGVSIQGLVSRQ